MAVTVRSRHQFRASDGKGGNREKKGLTLLRVLRAGRGRLVGRVVVLILGAVGVVILVKLVVRLVVDAIVFESLARKVVDGTRCVNDNDESAGHHDPPMQVP